MLHVVYRSYGGENSKERPAFYSKRLALGSMVRALRALPSNSVEIIYLNDGPIPADILRIMEQTGEVLNRDKLGNKGSLRDAFALPFDRGWADDDLMWIAEDDYLYRSDAIASLVAAATSYGEADYFGLYALIGHRMPSGKPFGSDRLPAVLRDSDAHRIVAHHAWRPAISTTSTFGAWVRTIKADRSMMLVAMETGGGFDHTTCLAFQGYTPFPLAHLARRIGQPASVSGKVRTVAIALVQVGFNIYAALWRAKHPHRLLVASDPALATHLETEHMAIGSDWGEVATDTQLWMEDNGLVPISPTSVTLAT